MIDGVLPKMRGDALREYFVHGKDVHTSHDCGKL